MLKICCVLRSGNEGYDWEYVERLYDQVSLNCDSGFEFIVFTDMYREGSEFQPITFNKNVEIVDLKKDLPGCWSKLEIFRLRGKVIYFDLDTIILKPIDELVKAVFLNEDTFFMLKAFNASRKYASGIMAWNGDFREIFSSFSTGNMSIYGKWEQDYISDFLSGISNIRYINNFLNIVSFKHHCKNGYPEEAEVICFHGNPRPHEIDWVVESKL